MFKLCNTFLRQASFSTWPWFMFEGPGHLLCHKLQLHLYYVFNLFCGNDREICCGKFYKLFFWHVLKITNFESIWKLLLSVRIKKNLTLLGRKSACLSNLRWSWQTNQNKMSKVHPSLFFINMDSWLSCGTEVLKLQPVKEEHTVERRTETKKEGVTVSAVRSNMTTCQ